VYLLDNNDLAIIAAVLLRLLARGHTVTPAMLAAILDCDRHRSDRVGSPVSAIDRAA
jgi:hypothetical protein